MSIEAAAPAGEDRAVPRVLIASYPRTGSTTLEAALRSMAGPDAVVLHEPFRSQPTPHSRTFATDLAEVAAETDVLKHHPGNVLSDRQNRLLYAAWLDGGGRIVHLRRSDVWAQARSLVIARAINSFHRPHRVGHVPPERVEAQHLELVAEIAHQSDVLADFDHVEVTYEGLCTGSTEDRIAAFERLLGRLDPASAGPVGAEARARLADVFSPRRQVRSTAATDRVPLVDQVPLFTDTVELLDPEACARLSDSIDRYLARHPGGNAASHGISTGWLADATGRSTAEGLRRHICERLATGASLRTTLGPDAPQLAFARCEGERDHDLDLWPLPIGSELLIAFTIALSDPATYVGGETHVSGWGPHSGSRRRGHLHYFASGLGARRAVVQEGSPITLIGALRPAPGQILAAGQLPWSASMFAD